MIPNLKIKTKEERDSLVSMLSELSRSLYSKKTGIDIKGFSEKWEKKPWFKEMSGFLKSVSGSDTGLSEKATSLGDLSQYLKGLDIIRISLPFDPTQSFVDEVFEVFAKDGVENFVISVEVDQTINSGARVFYQGRFLDLTLGSRISSLLEKEDVVNKYL